MEIFFYSVDTTLAGIQQSVIVLSVLPTVNIQFCMLIVISDISHFGAASKQVLCIKDGEINGKHNFKHELTVVNKSIDICFV